MIKFPFIKEKNFIKAHKLCSRKLNYLFKQYHHYGIHFHIIIFYLALNKFFKTDVILESGVGPGHSTKYINIYCSLYGTKSYSVDFNTNYLNQRVVNLKKLKKNSKFIEGDGYFELLKLVKKYKNKNITLLLDGPKGMRGLSLIYTCMLLNKNIKFALIDDVIKKSKTFNSLKKNKFAINIYDLMKKDSIFNKNKEKTLNIFRKDKRNLSNITTKTLFEKREWIIFKFDKNFFYPGLLKPYFLKVLIFFKLWFIIRFLVKIDNIIFKN